MHELMIYSELHFKKTSYKVNHINVKYICILMNIDSHSPVAFLFLLVLFFSVCDRCLSLISADQHLKLQ